MVLKSVLNSSKLEIAKVLTVTGDVLNHVIKQGKSNQIQILVILNRLF